VSGKAPGVVVVGGGPAGLAAARSYREHGGALGVTIVAAEAEAPYSRPPLTKEFLRGELGREELDLEAAGWYAEHEVDLRSATAAIALDPGERTVELAGGERLPFEACVLATGSEPQRPPVPGVAMLGVATVRTVGDAERLRGHGERVVVVGTGFIGCEAAASLAARGARVTLVGEEAPQRSRLGEEVAARLLAWLEADGVEPRVGAGIEAIEAGGDGGLRVRVPGRASGGASGRPSAAGGPGGASAPLSIPADTVLLATGVAPRLDLAQAAGLDLEGGAVRADERLRASAPGVLVAGDVAFAANDAAGRPLRVEHWGEALTQGAIAGATIAGAHERWANAPGFWSTIGERTLKHVAWGDGYESVRVEDGPDGAFTAWYADARGICVGVLAHGRDADYERGRELVEHGLPAP